MPHSSGLYLQEHVKQMKCQIPIIFATACTDDHVRKEAFAHGAVAFLDKPFGDEALLDAMCLALMY
jgi:FixJ family two-component response regulator